MRLYPLPLKFIVQITVLACAILIVSGAGKRAVAADDAPQCRMQKFATLPIQNNHGNRTVSGEINGTPATFFLDTGATDTLLMPNSVEKFGLLLEHADRTFVGVSGESRAHIANVKSFSIGSLKGGRRDVTVIESMGFVPPFDGIIGVDILFWHDLEIYLAKDVVNFFRPLDCGTTHLAYWDKNALFVKLQKVGSQDFRDVIDIEINGKKVHAILDMGAKRSVISRETAELLGVSKNSPGVKMFGSSTGAGGVHSVDLWMAKFDHVVIGRETIENANILIGDLREAPNKETNGMIDPDSFGDMLLGEDFFLAHRMLFSDAQRRLYYSFLGGPLFGSSAVTIKVEQADIK